MMKFIILLIASTLMLISQEPNLNWESSLEANSVQLEKLSGDRIIETKDKSAYIIACTPNEVKPWITKVGKNGVLEWSVGRPNIDGMNPVPIIQDPRAYAISESDNSYIFNGIHKENIPRYPLGKAFQFAISKESITGDENIMSKDDNDLLINPTLILNSPLNNNLITVGYLTGSYGFVSILHEVNRFARIQKTLSIDTIYGNVGQLLPLYITFTEDEHFLLLVGDIANTIISKLEFYIQEYDKDFKAVQTVKVETASLLDNYLPIPLKVQKVNNKIYVFGNFVHKSNSDTKPFVIQLNENMIIENYKIIDRKAYISSGFVNADGSVVIAGQKVDFQNFTGRDFYFAEINSSLANMVEYVWGDDEDNVVKDVIDGGTDYVVTGITGNDFYIASLQKTTVSVESNNLEKLLIVPNPSTNYISITGFDEAGLTPNVEIFDIYGKIVQITQSLNDIYVGNLANGSYTIKVSVGTSSEVLKFVKAN